MIRLFLREIRIEHTLFALPFAYVGAVVGSNGHVAVSQFLWITVAVFGARTAAMAANRLFDRRIDQHNPRTAKRATASGILPPHVMVTAIILGLACTLLAAWELQPLCVALLPLAAFGILLYPLCKRFTWLTHFVLGMVDGFAPLGASIAVSGHVTLAGMLLFVAVTLWVAGFDIYYALMDLDIDIEQGLSSIPARFGARVAEWLPSALHSCMIILLATVGWVTHVGAVYALGLLTAVLLVVYEQRLILRHDSAFTLNDKIFQANMAFSLIFLATTCGGYIYRTSFTS